MDSLPIVDFSSTDTEGTASRIVHIMETVGFLYLDNVPGYNLEEEAELLEINKWFFNLPEEKRLKVARYLYNKKNKVFYRGYFGLDKDYSSYKEGYEFGQDSITSPGFQLTSKEGLPVTEENVWPEPEPSDSQEEKERYAKFKEVVVKHYGRMMSASMRFLQLLAIGLGLPEKYFHHLFVPETLSTLRLLHYPQRGFEPPPSAIEDGQVVVCETHADNVFVTFLITFNYTGLQVLLHDNTWLTVQPRPGSFVVNLGKTLSESTGGRIKATKHRVVDPGGERYSLPFFLEPGYSAKVPLSLPLDGKEEEDVEYMQYGPWLLENMKKYAEIKDVLKLFEESGLKEN